MDGVGIRLNMAMYSRVCVTLSGLCFGKRLGLNRHGIAFASGGVKVLS
jgi:hypothetical protein